MNMKKTMAAIAAGAVAVSAMATTVSAVTLETKTLTYNLVKTVKQKSDASVKLTAKFYNVPLEAGGAATFKVKNLGEKDVIRISGVYIEEGKQIVPIVGTKDTGNGGVYSPATAAMITTGANGTIVVPIVASNTANGVALMGGTAGVPGTPAVVEVPSALSKPATDAVAATLPTGAALTQATLNTKATDKIVFTVNHPDQNAAATFTAQVGTATPVTGITAAQLKVDWGIDVAGVTSWGADAAGTGATTAGTDNGKKFEASKYVAPADEVPAVEANNVSANITVEVTMKDLSRFVNDEFKTPAGNEILKDLENCSKELAAVTSVFGAGLATTQADGTTAGYNATSTDMTVSDHTSTTKVYQYPYKSSLNNYLYTSTTNINNLALVQGEGGDVLNHIYTVKTDDNSEKINPISVQAVINDAVSKHGEVTFVFNTATKGVKVNAGGGWYMNDGFGAYALDDWAKDQSSNTGVVDFTSFGNHYYNSNQAGYDPNTQYILNNWLGDNLFNGTLIVNSNLTLALNDTQKFDWTQTSLSFTWEAIQDEALTTNQYANYIQNMVLRTSADWYWDNMQVVLGETEVEEVESGAPVEGDTVDLEEEEEEEIDPVEEEEEEVDPVEEEEEEEEPEVAPVVEEKNPGTGNASVALAVIPVALAAAAIVAKKRG